MRGWMCVDVVHRSTPTQCMLTLWSSLLGNIDVEEFLVSNYYMGIFLFMWFSFIVLFTCLTFMISGVLFGGAAMAVL